MHGASLRSLCRLSRHCLHKSEDQANSPEHQLWLLSSGALDTAAAIANFDGSASACFDALEGQRNGSATGGLEWGKYMQRHYATEAMRQYVEHADQAPHRRRWLTPENLPAAWTIATAFTILSAWLLSLYLFPTDRWL